jgi:hypothetical protein
MLVTQLIDRFRDDAADGVARLSGWAARRIDDAGETFAEATDSAAMTAARVSGETGEAAGRYAAQACDWLAGQVSQWGERMAERVTR